MTSQIALSIAEQRYFLQKNVQIIRLLQLVWTYLKIRSLETTYVSEGGEHWKSWALV